MTVQANRQALSLFNPMDPVTHGLAGAVIAKAGFSRSLGKMGTITGIVVALSPDSDFILRLFGEETFLRYHRGMTHSLILLPVYSLVLAFFFQRISKKKNFLYFYLLCFMSLLSHILLDLVTSFGTMALSPLSDQRLAWDIIFIIDPYFTAILIVPFLLTYHFKRYNRELGVLSLSLLIPYIALCIFSHNAAVAMAHREAGARNLVPGAVAALPQPLSPFKWVLLIDSGDVLYQRFADIRDKDNSGEGIDGIMWKKWPASPWTDRALKLPGVEFYLWFARFPVAVLKDMEDGHHLVEFIDLRFDILRDRIPFTYRVEFDKDGAVVLEKFTTVNSFLDNYGRR